MNYIFVPQVDIIYHLATLYEVSFGSNSSFANEQPKARPMSVKSNSAQDEPDLLLKIFPLLALQMKHFL